METYPCPLHPDSPEPGSAWSLSPEPTCLPVTSFPSSTTQIISPQPVFQPIYTPSTALQYRQGIAPGPTPHSDLEHRPELAFSPPALRPATPIPSSIQPLPQAPSYRLPTPPIASQLATPQLTSDITTPQSTPPYFTTPEPVPSQTLNTQPTTSQRSQDETTPSHLLPATSQSTTLIHQPPHHSLQPHTITPTPTPLPHHTLTNWNPLICGPRPIAIIGAGVLGRRIASVFSAAGHTVHLVDPSSRARNDSLTYISTHKPEYERYILIPRKEGACDTFHDLTRAVSNAWLAIETVPEQLPLKVDVMGALDAETPRDCILASNSSSFKTSFMVEKVSRQRRPLVCNMHFTMPPRIRAVELMTNGETYLEVLSFLTWVLDDCGMMPVTARKDEGTGLVRSHCLNTVN